MPDLAQALGVTLIYYGGAVAAAHAIATLIGRGQEAMTDDQELTHQVYRDGQPVSEPLSNEDAFAWLLRHQSQSVDWACRYEGYEIRELR